MFKVKTQITGLKVKYKISKHRTKIKEMEIIREMMRFER